MDIVAYEWGKNNDNPCGGLADQPGGNFQVPEEGPHAHGSNDAPEATPCDAGDTDPDTADTDSVEYELARQAIDGITPGWTTDAVAGFLERLYKDLAAVPELGTQQLEGLLEALNDRLRANGYPDEVRTPKQWRAAFRQWRKGKNRPAGLTTVSRGTSNPPNGTSPRFAALSREAGNQPEGVPACGIVDRENGNRLLANFELFVDEDVEVQDDVEPSTSFSGRLVLPDRQYPFRIRAADYARDALLQSALYTAGGSGIQLYCKPDLLRNAVAQISTGRVRRSTTTNFGWSDDGTCYRVPSGTITADGFTPSSAGDGLRVDLGDCAQARHLDLKALEPGELARVKRHVVEELLLLHDRTVTHALLGLAAAAVLRRFSGSTQRFAGWLKGDSGDGKTLAASLFMSFFGDFPPAAESRFLSWSATPNAVERAGYFYRDSLFLVDDFKAATANLNQVVRVLQAYGDGTSRGRLRADSSFQATRPIRGLLLVTGENNVDHEASSTARTILVPVPPLAQKDVARCQRCLAESVHYPGVMADFLRWLLAGGRTLSFAGKVAVRRAFFHAGLDGQPNGGRIAENFGVLAAAYEEFAEYLGDAWPGWREESRDFVETGLVGLRDAMLGKVREQRSVAIFLDVLAELVGHRRVRLDPSEDGHGPVIGKRDLTHPGSYWVSSELALGEVQRFLLTQGRPTLPLQVGDLTGMLKREGKLAACGTGSKGQRRVDGSVRRCFLTSREALLEGSATEEEARPEPRPRNLKPVPQRLAAHLGAVGVGVN